MRWLAIDPSLRNTGWAYMDDQAVYEVGLIQTVKGGPPVYLDNQRRMGIIADRIWEALVSTAAGAIYAEAKSGSKSAKANAAMAMVQGVLVGVAVVSVEVVLMLPQTVKLTVCGDRKASKDDIKLRVQQLYPGAEEHMLSMGITQKASQEHVYDAIAIGWAINYERTK